MTVDNELYRPWIDDSTRRIVVAQMVPARIEALADSSDEEPDFCATDTALVAANVATALATYRLSAGRASQVLHQLAEANILRLSARRAGRAQVWVAHEMIDAVDTINATIPRRHLHADTGLDL